MVSNLTLIKTQCGTWNLHLETQQAHFSFDAGIVAIEEPARASVFLFIMFLILAFKKKLLKLYFIICLNEILTTRWKQRFDSAVIFSIFSAPVYSALW